MRRNVAGSYRRSLFGMVFVGAFILWSTLATTKAFAYENSKPFADLPADNGHYNHIQKFAAATVGIVRYDGSSCTGIRISKYTIMTAAHCLADSDPKYGFVLWQYNTTTHGYSELDIEAGDFMFDIPSIYEQYRHYPNPNDRTCMIGIILCPELISSDIAIINISNVVRELDDDNFINIHTPRQITTEINNLNNYLFNPQTQLYAFGWGSHQTFKYATRLSKADTSSNSTLAYSDIPSDMSCTSWSYLLTNLALNLNPYRLANYGTLLTNNLPNDFYSYTNSSASYWQQENGNDLDIFVNTSVLLVGYLPDNDGNYINSEPGDSGGPIIACRNQDSRDCSLVAILSTGSTAKRLSYYVTMIGPIADGYLLAAR